MGCTTITTGSIARASLILAIISCVAADWATVHGNVQRTGYTADCVRGPYRLEWVAEFPGESVSTRVEAIVAGDAVLVGTQGGTLWALDRVTGAVRWQHRADGPIQHSPACDGGRVFVGDTGGTLWAVEAVTGRPVWRFRSGKGGFVASPLVARGMVYLGSRDGNFYAVAADTGALRWRFPTGGPIRNTAALAGDRVLFASDDMHAYALGADTGKELWKSVKLYGQSFRDYYPVILDGRAVFRSVLVEEMNDELNGGTAFLQKRAGIPGGWRELEAFFKSDASRGTSESIRAEQEAIRQRLESNPYRRTCFVLDLETGREVLRPPVLYIAGNQGAGIPPVLTADERAVFFYRTVYSNWNRGVKPAVGVGYLDPRDGSLSPIRHRQGNVPPWNTFWGTCDETTNFSVGGDLLYCTHQGTLSALDLKTLNLFPIHGNRDTWGGLLTPVWAANEWHGPARGAVAIAGDRLFWVTGSRVLCLRGGVKAVGPGRRTGPRAEEGFTPGKGEARPLGGQVPSGGRDLPAIARLLEEPHRKASGDRDGLRAELAREVAELLDGWPWAPFYLQMGIGSRDFFFAHPSYAVQALALAYPHLPPDLAARARERTHQELPGCLQAQSLSLDAGRRRELYAVPPHDLTWTYHPRWPEVSHLHAIWLYGDRTGDWEAVRALWPRMQEIWRQYQARPVTAPFLYMNRTAAGCIAYGRLAQRFGTKSDVEDTTRELGRLMPSILAAYRTSAAVAGDTLRQRTSKGDTHHNQGRKLYFHLNNHKSKLALFLDLTPELGRTLAEAAPEETATLRRWVELLMPAFYLAFEERNIHYGENFVDLPDTVHGLFLAHAYLWGASPEMLARYTDLPWVRADLFHIEKLVFTLEQ